MFALAMRALCIFLVKRRHAHHAASLAITPEISCKHAQHTLSIESVRLGSSGAAIDQNARRLEHIVGDIMCCQKSMQPESVTSSLKAADNINCSTAPPSNTGA
jgi:hypothetical protein